MMKAIVVHKRDIESASVLLREMMAQAEALWIPSDAIVEALVDELRLLTLRTGEPNAAVAYLRALAEEIEASPEVDFPDHGHTAWRRFPT